MNTIFFRSFFITNILTLFGCLYSAEKHSRPPMPLPPKYIPFEKRNNRIYIEVKDQSKNTPITLRYFTREQGCAPGYYFKTESIIPLANIRSNPYSCSVTRKSNETSYITFTYQTLKKTVSAKQNNTFVVHPESNKMIRITESNVVVAEFTFK